MRKSSTAIRSKEHLFYCRLASSFVSHDNHNITSLFKAYIGVFLITCVRHFLEQFQCESVARRSFLLRAPGNEATPQKARCALLGFSSFFDFHIGLRTVLYRTTVRTILEGYPYLVHDFLFALTNVDHVRRCKGSVAREITDYLN